MEDKKGSSFRDKLRICKAGSSKYAIWKVVSGVLAVLLVISILTGGFGIYDREESGGEEAITGGATLDMDGGGAGAAVTFDVLEDAEICREDGRPVIRMFSTTTCPHCTWISSTFDGVVKEYVVSGEIVAHHWQLDIKDDTITSQRERGLPDSEMAIFKRFNPKMYVPLFVFGCKYSRVGNGYEDEGNLAKEADEFRKIIDELVEAS